MILAVDPGGAHVGIAWFERENGGAWACVDAIEYNPHEFAHILLRGLLAQPITQRPQALIYEEFRIYPDKALAQIGSHVETAECIGVLKHYAELMGAPEHLTLVSQPASYQRVALGLLRVRKMTSTAKKLKAGPHALSAELHGWAYLLRS